MEASVVELRYKMKEVLAVGGDMILYDIEEYALSNGLRDRDAIIAATATENNLTLLTSNAKHFKSIKDLRLKIFKP